MIITSPRTFQKMRPCRAPPPKPNSTPPTAFIVARDALQSHGGQPFITPILPTTAAVLPWALRAPFRTFEPPPRAQPARLFVQFAADDARPLIVSLNFIKQGSKSLIWLVCEPKGMIPMPAGDALDATAQGSQLPLLTPQRTLHLEVLCRRTVWLTQKRMAGAL